MEALLSLDVVHGGVGAGTSPKLALGLDVASPSGGAGGQERRHGRFIVRREAFPEDANGGGVGEGMGAVDRGGSRGAAARAKGGRKWGIEEKRLWCRVSSAWLGVGEYRCGCGVAWTVQVWMRVMLETDPVESRTPGSVPYVPIFEIKACQPQPARSVNKHYLWQRIHRRRRTNIH
jgi:hypothetical protein